MNKKDNVAFWGGISLLFLLIVLTGRQSLFGTVLGYWLGYLNTRWLYRDTVHSVNLNVFDAIKRMRRSFFARLGIVTLVVAGVAHYNKSWLPGLAVGIALGLMVSLFFISRRHFLEERGD